MSITITPLSPERLGVAGDITMELRVPFDPDEDRFHLAFSDGTLIAGEYDPEQEQSRSLVEIEGAGIARVAGEVLMLDWQAEWVTIAIYRTETVAAHDPGPFPRLRGA